MRYILATVSMVFLVCALAGCSSGSSGSSGPGPGDGTDGIDGIDATDVGDGTDATATTDGADGLSCQDFEEGDPCGPETNALGCINRITWCAQETEESGCDCSEGTWFCWSNGVPADCHECCADALGELFYCVNGQCVESP